MPEASLLSYGLAATRPLIFPALFPLTTRTKPSGSPSVLSSSRGTTGLWREWERAAAALPEAAPRPSP